MQFNINEKVETRWDKQNQLKDLKSQLTLLFIGGRCPSNSEMVRVEELRDQIATLESELRYGA